MIGCDAVELAREFGTPATWRRGRPARQGARAARPARSLDGPRRARRRTRDRRLRAEGLGCACAARSHLALRAGFGAERIYCTATRSREAELRGGRGRRIGDDRDDAPIRSARASVAHERRRAAAARDAGVTPTPTRDHHRPRGLEVRLRAGRGRRARRPPARPPRRRRPALPPRLPALRPRAVPRRGRGARPARGLRRSTTSAAAWRGLHGGGPRAGAGGLRGRHGRGRARGARARQAARDRAGARAGGQRGRDALHGASRSSGAAHGRLVAVDGGMSDNLRPMLYGAVYEARRSPTALDGRRRAGHTWSASTASPATCSSRDASCRDPRPGDVARHARSPAPTGTRMANNYNGVPRPPVIFCSGGAARVVVRRETYEDLHARDVSGSACSATARSARAFAKLLARARRRDRARSPGCAPSSPAC